MEEGRNWKRKSNKNLARRLEKSNLKPKTSRLGGGLGAFGGDLGKKNGQEAVLADLGRFWTGAGCSKWRQDASRWGLAGHLEADWGVILAILEGLGGRSLQKWPKYRNEHFSVLATFSGLGGSGWRLLGLPWAILART